MRSNAGKQDRISALSEITRLLWAGYRSPENTKWPLESFNVYKDSSVLSKQLSAIKRKVFNHILDLLWKSCELKPGGPPHNYYHRNQSWSISSIKRGLERCSGEQLAFCNSSLCSACRCSIKGDYLGIICMIVLCHQCLVVADSEL